MHVKVQDQDFTSEEGLTNVMQECEGWCDILDDVGGLPLSERPPLLDVVEERTPLSLLEDENQVLRGLEEIENLCAWSHRFKKEKGKKKENNDWFPMDGQGRHGKENGLRKDSEDHEALEPWGY
jgi:hypothetical protein